MVKKRRGNTKESWELLQNDLRHNRKKKKIVDTCVYNRKL